MSQTRNDRIIFLSAQHTKHVRKAQSNFFANGYKAGKLLTAQVKQRVEKQKIPHIIHPTKGGKLYNPQDIANAFSEFYSTLYNLGDDSYTSQPSDEIIFKFLDSLTLPTLSEAHLQDLNAPFSSRKEGITLLPNNKVPGPDSFSANY